MDRCNRLLTTCLLAALLATLGCATKVHIPPRVDLAAWHTIGLVEFSGDPELLLRTLATRDFMQRLQAAQPGVRIVELGSQQRVLREVGHGELDFESARAIGERFEVDAVFVGDLDFSEVKPSVAVGRAFASLEARVDVNGQAAAKLFETRSGATVWSRSSSASANVARIGLRYGVIPTFGASDPSEVHAGLVHQLITDLTGDFYWRWEKQ